MCSGETVALGEDKDDNCDDNNDDENDYQTWLADDRT